MSDAALTHRDFTPAEVKNVIASMHFIERSDLEREFGEPVGDGIWRMFRENPSDTFVRVGDRMKAAITTCINKHLGGRNG